MKNMTEGQIDLLFTMLVSEAMGTDPFETEEALKEKGIINKPSTV